VAGSLLIAAALAAAAGALLRLLYFNSQNNQSHTFTTQERKRHVHFFFKLHIRVQTGGCTNLIFCYLHMDPSLHWGGGATKLRKFEMSINLQNSYKRREETIYLLETFTNHIVRARGQEWKSGIQKRKRGKQAKAHPRSLPHSFPHSLPSLTYPPFYSSTPAAAIT
jgi:hypothetical protein